MNVEKPTERNRLATFPSTTAARQNHSVLLKRSRQVRYESIGRATGHDKSWVSRFLSGSALISFPELLAWLDLCDLHLISPEGEHESGASPEEWLERLRLTIEALDLVRLELGTKSHTEHEFILALIEFARIGLTSLLERHTQAAYDVGRDGSKELTAPDSGK